MALRKKFTKLEATSKRLLITSLSLTVFLVIGANGQFDASHGENGIGISEKDISKIFEAYYRSSTMAQTSGEGLGLYLAKENLNIINGEITVTSKVNFGSKFVITIPKTPTSE